SKGAVVAMTLPLAREFAREAIRVMTIAPGIMETPMLKGMPQNVQDALGQMMRANKVSEATPEMLEAASESALRRVFQDDNAVTDTMQKLRNDFPFIGEIVAPFVKTPSNVVKIGIEYTPVGIAEGMMKAFVGENSIRKLQQQGVDTMALQRQCAELIGRGSIGTVLMLLGMALGQAKVGTGDEEEHQNQNQFNRMIGKIPNSFKIGDTYIDLSSLQSAAVPLLAGSAIGAARKDQKGTAEDYLRGLLAGTVKAGNTATEMPMVQGISELLGGGYEKQGFAETLAKLGADAVSQIVPFGSLGRQAANAIDPYSRDRSSDSMLERELVNPVKAQIPGLANNFPIRYDTLGNPQKTYEADTA
ncbi:MAG: SDR family oxidoreductase, partial [Clostridiales bacterium]